jgi:uncharacterized membrane protein
MNAELVVLRFVHILAGALWFGGAAMILFFLMPAARDLGPAGGELMRYLTRTRSLPRWMLTMTLLTVVSGLGLFYRVSGGFDAAWMGSRAGITFSVGGALGILTAVVGLLVNSPTAKRLGALGAEIARGGQGPTPAQGVELARLQTRLRVASLAGVGMLGVAVAAMAVARYL